VAEGQNEMAEKVLDRCAELIPNKVVPYDYFSVMMSETYFKAGKVEKGKQMIAIIMNNYKEKLDYYYKLNRPMRTSVDEDIQRCLYFMREINMICAKYKQMELFKDVSSSFNKYLDKYSSLN